MSIPDEFMWAIGLFEGEGNIHAHSNGRTPNREYLQIRLDMTDRDVVERFCRVVGCGHIRGPIAKSGNRKPQWSWSASGRNAETLLRRFLPELGSRRTELALVALAATVSGENVEQLRIHVSKA